MPAFDCQTQQHSFALEIGFVWVRLGSFWLWGPLTGQKLGLFWVRLGSFGFVFGRLEERCFVVSLCGKEGCVDFGCFRNWVRLYKKGLNGKR